MEELGICNYCGKVAILDYPANSTQNEKSELATNYCECTRAAKERENKREIERAKERIEQLFGNEAVEMGFEPIAKKEIVHLMNTIVEMVSKNIIIATTITIDSKTRAKVSISSKGRINIERSQTTRYKLET